MLKLLFVLLLDKLPPTLSAKNYRNHILRTYRHVAPRSQYEERIEITYHIYYHYRIKVSAITGEGKGRKDGKDGLFEGPGKSWDKGKVAQSKGDGKGWEKGWGKGWEKGWEKS